jgi:hypothetical protein
MTDRYQDQIWAECERIGEAEVRANKKKGTYAGKHLRYVEAWLVHREVARSASDDARSLASQAKQMRIARSAKNAAWAAAIAAIIAAMSAIIAIFYHH